MRLISFRWMCEKYNGIRVFWDGHQLITAKQRQLVPLPLSVRSELPSIPFEAELWYNQPPNIMVRRSGYDTPIDLTNANWNRIKFCIFDVPTRWSDTYEDRLKFLQQNIRTFYTGSL